MTDFLEMFKKEDMVRDAIEGIDTQSDVRSMELMVDQFMNDMKASGIECTREQCRTPMTNFMKNFLTVWLRKTMTQSLGRYNFATGQTEPESLEEMKERLRKSYGV